MADFSADRALLVFLLLNLGVCGSAFLFCRRRAGSSGSQLLLDTALLSFAIQYLSVGIPGLIKRLHPLDVEGTSMLLSIGLVACSIGKNQIAIFSPGKERGQTAKPLALWLTLVPASVLAVALFVIIFVIAYVRTQAYLPVISNDALTYHFPAAVQWLQHGRIDLFQTWFFNPANTYSPLAGSIFIVWLIVPFGSDVLARFVEVPALLCVGLAMYRLCRVMEPGEEPGRLGSVTSTAAHLQPRRLSSALIAAAAVLSRPIFLPCMMGKDDLFVAFFFIASLIALSRSASDSRFGSARFGIALGLLLSTKYTALLCVPLLLLAIHRQPLRYWIAAIPVTVLFAGPWYLRNWILTGNPLFPLAVPHLFHGLFTTVHSSAFASIGGGTAVAVGGAYGLPIALTSVLVLAWILCLALGRRGLLRRPVCRTCVLGSALGGIIFFWQSPFPEVRFLLPTFLLLFGCLPLALDGIRASRTAAGLVLICSVVTLFDCKAWSATATFAAAGLTIAASGMAAAWWAGSRRIRWLAVGGGCAAALTIYTYINWSAYYANYNNASAYGREYPDLDPLWRFVNENAPANANVAYTNLYLVYPLQGPSLMRRLFYVPTRPGVSSVADIGWLGNDLPGEQLVPNAVRATLASADPIFWLQSLYKSGAEYLIIGRGGVAGVPAEAGFVLNDPRFTLLFQGEGGSVYGVARANAEQTVGAH